jgi:hypothetical protein
MRQPWTGPRQYQLESAHEHAVLATVCTVQGLLSQHATGCVGGGKTVQGPGITILFILAPQ